MVILGSDCGSEAIR